MPTAAANGIEIEYEAFGDETAPLVVAEQATIACPVAIVHGRDDPILGHDQAREIARRIPHATLDIVEGMGHEMPREVRGRLYDHIAVT